MRGEDGHKGSHTSIGEKGIATSKTSIEVSPDPSDEKAKALIAANQVVTASKTACNLANVKLSLNSGKRLFELHWSLFQEQHLV